MHLGESFSSLRTMFGIIDLFLSFCSKVVESCCKDKRVTLFFALLGRQCSLDQFGEERVLIYVLMPLEVMF